MGHDTNQLGITKITDKLVTIFTNFYFTLFAKFPLFRDYFLKLKAYCQVLLWILPLCLFEAAKFLSVAVFDN